MEDYNKMNYTTKILKRFWSKVIISDDYINQCWIWTGYINNGYGSVYVNGKQIRAHIFSYQSYNGPFLKNLLIRHTCDIKTCVNPNHLLIGTHQDNMDDAVERNKIAHGEKQGISILTENKAKFILISLLNDTYSSRQLANMFGVKRTTINKISSGRNWKRVYDTFSNDEKKKIRYNISNNAGNPRVISPNDVKLMREIFENNKISYDKIANQFNIATMTAYNIINRKSWKHI